MLSMLEVAKSIIAKTAERGGGMFDLHGASIYRYEGFEVAPFQLGITIVFCSKDTPGYLAEWLQKISGGVKHYHIGTYVHEGMLYVDVTLTCNDELEALHIARMAKENVIWSWRDGKHRSVYKSPVEELPSWSLGD